jgi:hypothetical protein
MKGSYAPLHELPPDHHRKAALLQQVRQFLQHPALFPAARQSAGGKNLLTVRITRFEHTAAQRLAIFSALRFSAWPWPWISVFGDCGSLSRFLRPQTLYRSKRSSAFDVHWIPARSSFAALDDVAQRTAWTDRWNLETDVWKKKQRQDAQALKEEERRLERSDMDEIG